MKADFVFSIASMLVLPQWILMIFLPKWKGTKWLIQHPIIPGILAIIYVIFLASTTGIEGGGFGSLQEVKALFTVDNAVLAGWVHYLAFDLLIGSWVLTNGQQNKLPHLALIPCMFFCFMAGLVGWGLYMILRTFLTKK